MSVILQRVYERGERMQGYRVLVDRVWPRKEELHLDEWLKKLVPSTE